MKTFSENLDKYCHESDASEATIADMGEICLVDLDNLSAGKYSKDLLYKFCVNSYLDISSIYSDEGFKMVSLKDQYNEYPTQLKKTISRLFCKQLIKRYCAGSESQFKVFLKLTKIGSQILSRVLTGSSCFSPADFDEVFSGMSQVASEAQCRELLAKCMYSLIPNYNFSVGKEYYKVSYSTLSPVLGVTGSAISNWGSIGAVPIPEIYFDKIVKYFDIEKERFITQILITTADFSGKHLNLDESSVTEQSAVKVEPLDIKIAYTGTGKSFIDPPTDDPIKEEVVEPAKTPAKKKKTKRSKAKPAKERKTKSRQIAPSDSLTAPADKMTMNPNNSLEPYSAYYGSQVEAAPVGFTDDMVHKMYNNLSLSNKMKANQMIAELFFSQI